MNTYGVIMAGGGGTRFWPLSRQKTPKQLLNLSGNELMVNEAIDRLSYIVAKKNIFIVTNAVQVDSMLKATEGRVWPDHILSEPSARNTAACIGYAAVEIVKKYGDGVMVITPSDHYIKDNASFTRLLNTAVKIAEKEDKLITIGIPPAFPSTGFGYIKYDQITTGDAKPVVEIKEKPDEEEAKEYIASGQYLWNSGMFVWKASLILEKFKEFIPDIYKDLMKIGKAMGTMDERVVIDAVYPDIRKISIDYAIMEPSALKGNVLVIPGEFGWNDVGNWDMMDALQDVDSDGNVRIGDILTVNTTNSVLYSSGKMIAVVGMDDLVVVEAPDAIMVCRKDKAQDVKLIVEALKTAERKELL